SAAALGQTRVTARTAGKPAGSAPETGRSRTAARALRPNRCGFESRHTRRVSTRAAAISGAAGGAGLCGALLHSGDTFGTWAAPPLAADFHGVSGSLPAAVPLFRSRRANHYSR